MVEIPPAVSFPIAWQQYNVSDAHYSTTTTSPKAPPVLCDVALLRMFATAVSYACAESQLTYARLQLLCS